MRELYVLTADIWRIVPKGFSNSPIQPAQAPEGRFHHSGQTAVYASMTAEGAKVAVKRYLVDGVERVLAPIKLEAELVANECKNPDAAVAWHIQRSEGVRPETWAVSDSARARGAQAMIYNSRTRPDLTHIVVFDPKCLTANGTAVDLFND
ncbi:MAG: RES family NAD+ phosphorylase [Pseudomonadota bacterium]